MMNEEELRQEAQEVQEAQEEQEVEEPQEVQEESRVPVHLRPYTFTKGHPLMGGKKKGTPNKKNRAKAPLIMNVAAHLPGEPEHFGEDFVLWLANMWKNTTLKDDWSRLTPYERFAVFDKLYQFVVPKKNAASANINIRITHTIEDDLIELAQEFADDATEIPDIE